MSIKFCGITVDEKIYNEYCGKEYIVPWDSEQKPLTLKKIEFFANCKDYAEHCPEFSQACKKIVAETAAEIKSKYLNGKGFKFMKHNNFSDYIKDLQEIQRNAAKERADLREKHSIAKKRWDEISHDNSVDEYTFTNGKMRWLEAEKEYKEALTNLKNKTDASIEAVRAEFDEHIDDFYSANGNRIDDGMIRLLNSGLKLTEKEVERLVSQNISNPTALRLISDHCDKYKIESKAALFYGNKAKSVGEGERKHFNDVVSMINRTISDDETTAKVWGAESDHFTRLSEQAISDMSSMAVRPATEA